MPELLKDPSLDVRMASIAHLVAKRPTEAIESLKLAVVSREFKERQSAWDLLGSMNLQPAKDLIADGVIRYLNGSLERDCWINVAEAAKGKLEPALEENWLIKWTN